MAAQPAGAGMELTPAPFAALRGWHDDAVGEAAKALADSCRALLAGVPSDPPARPDLGVPTARWQAVCEAFVGRFGDARPTRDADDAVRAFLETWFTPHLVRDDGDPWGLITGYYEIELTGSMTRSGRDQVPLYRLPPSDRLRRQPRTALASGGLAGLGLVLVWVDDAIDAFFLEIQGSGAIALRDGTTRRVRYTGFNGHRYRPIGRRLAELGEIALADVTMQSIRRWLDDHPDRAQAVMNYNESYVYFDWLETGAPQGSQGTDLSPGRSLAIDPRYLPYGAPIWLETSHPVTGAPLHRLMVAHDKGGAIKGPVRADFFWGTGAAAGELAGRMKHQGRYFVLLPRQSPAGTAP